MTFVRQSFIILLSIALVMSFKSFFVNAIVPIVSIMILLYIFISKPKKIQNLNLFALTAFVLLLVSLTGEITSPLFFLLYFLSFAVAFIFDPKVVFVFTAGLIVALFPGALKTDLTHNLILLFSLFLLSPLAFFLGVNYRKNHKIKLRAKIFYFSFLILNFSFLILNFGHAYGQSMSNQKYIIKTEDLNAIPDFTPSPFVPEGVNFKVKTGFENIPSGSFFSVSISEEVIDFGKLSPTNPIVRTVDLSVDSLSASGYSILVSENHPLENNQTNIPDTTCDNGECDQEKAGAWTNTLTYGFGYRCDNTIGTDCNSSFSMANSYKHFADISNGETATSVMAGIGSKQKSVRLSYKVNISRNQSQGTYANVITYIAVPNF